jgi:polar amino acid transport system substrate-binding protein
MQHTPRKGAIGAIVALLILAACSANNAGTSPSAAASSGASGQASQSAAPSQVATVPDSELIQPGQLFVCIDIPYPPQEAFDANGQAIGSDPDIAAAIAARLGLKFDAAHIENTVFAVIIPALDGNKCDIIVSAQNITADRVKQVDMVPYFKAGQSVVVPAGNPKGIKTQGDMCGKTIAAETGTTEVDFMQGQGDYKGDGLSSECLKAGKPVINVKQFDKDSDALLALQAGTVDAYFADSPAAGYAVSHSSGKLELSGITLEQAIEGISVAKNHTHLRDGVKAALLAMINDGTYMQILTKWGVQDGAITADQLNTGHL